MKFIVTDELGRLATWLRILGFDTEIGHDRAGLVLTSLRDERIILTRDSKMSRFTGTRMVKISSDFVEKQLEQVIRELDVKTDRKELFTRCVVCNELLGPALKASVKDEVPEYVFNTQEEFTRCPKCDKVYWHGTHWVLANQFLDRISGKA